MTDPLTQEAKNQLFLNAVDDVQAGIEGGVENLKFALDNGAEIDNDNNGYSEEPLISVIGHTGGADIVEVLLKKGAKVSVRSTEGLTPFLLASKNGNHQVVKLLLDWECDISDRNTQGFTALTYAVRGLARIRMMDDAGVERYFKTIEHLIDGGLSLSEESNSRESNYELLVKQKIEYAKGGTRDGLERSMRLQGRVDDIIHRETLNKAVIKLSSHMAKKEDGSFIMDPKQWLKGLTAQHKNLVLAAEQDIRAIKQAEHSENYVMFYLPSDLQNYVGQFFGFITGQEKTTGTKNAKKTEEHGIENMPLEYRTLKASKVKIMGKHTRALAAEESEPNSNIRPY